MKHGSNSIYQNNGSVYLVDVFVSGENMFRIFRKMTLFHGIPFTLGHVKRVEEGPKPVATANILNCSHYHVDKVAI